jgi:glycosyltransferase involved in cell wall biosynthesis
VNSEHSSSPAVGVSVIVPVYNRERLISGTLESLLSQRFDDFEVIIVDDGSTDGTADVVKAFSDRDRRIRYVLQENAGPGAARNRGIGEACGAWIAFLDSDDLWEPDKLSNFSAVVEANPKIDFMHTNWQALYLDGTKSNPRDMKNFDALSSKIHLLSTFSLKTSTIMVRKDLLDRIGGYFYTDSPLYEDFHLFWRAVMEASAIGYVQSCDTVVVQTKNSLGRSITRETNTKAKIFAMDRVRRWIEERSLPSDYAGIFTMRIYREFQTLFRLLLRAKAFAGLRQEFRNCSRLLSPARAARALASSVLDELRQST